LAEHLEKDRFQHMPAKEGTCLECHVPHYADVEDLLAETGADLCKGCHKLDEASMEIAHHAIGLEGTNCTGCHEGHSADNEGLMHKVLHAPFEKEECVACH